MKKILFIIGFIFILNSICFAKTITYNGQTYSDDKIVKAYENYMTISSTGSTQQIISAKNELDKIIKEQNTRIYIARFNSMEGDKAEFKASTKDAAEQQLKNYAINKLKTLSPAQRKSFNVVESSSKTEGNVIITEYKREYIGFTLIFRKDPVNNYNDVIEVFDEISLANAEKKLKEKVSAAGFDANKLVVIDEIKTSSASKKIYYAINGLDGVTSNGWKKNGPYWNYFVNGQKRLLKWARVDNNNPYTVKDNWTSEYCCYLDSSGNLVANKQNYKIGTYYFNIDLNGIATKIDSNNSSQNKTINNINITTPNINNSNYTTITFGTWKGSEGSYWFDQGNGQYPSGNKWFYITTNGGYSGWENYYYWFDNEGYWRPQWYAKDNPANYQTWVSNSSSPKNIDSKVNQPSIINGGSFSSGDSKNSGNSSYIPTPTNPNTNIIAGDTSKIEAARANAGNADLGQGKGFNASSNLINQIEAARNTYYGTGTNNSPITNNISSNPITNNISNNPVPTNINNNISSNIINNTPVSTNTNQNISNNINNTTNISKKIDNSEIDSLFDEKGKFEGEMWTSKTGEYAKQDSNKNWDNLAGNEWDLYTINQKTSDKKGVWIKWGSDWYFITDATEPLTYSNEKKSGIKTGLNGNGTQYVVQNTITAGTYCIDKKLYEFDDNGKLLSNSTGIIGSQGIVITLKTDGTINKGHELSIDESEINLKIYEKNDFESTGTKYITTKEDSKNYTVLGNGYFILKNTDTNYSLINASKPLSATKISSAGTSLSSIKKYINNKNYEEAYEVTVTDGKLETNSSSNNSSNTSSSNNTSTTKTVTTITYNSIIDVINKGILNAKDNAVIIDIGKEFVSNQKAYNSVDNKTYTVNNDGIITNTVNGKSNNTVSGSYDIIKIGNDQYLVKK